MNLLNNNQRAPYEPGVYMLTGVNGIGKSTIVDQISASRPEVVSMHASQELRSLFGDVTRYELESLKPEEKLAKMVVHFTAKFDKLLDDSKAVVLDTHLLVPIRKEGSVIYEDIWSDAYAPYTTSMVMLSAQPSNIRAWRLRDEAATGRMRNTDIQNITLDQDQNLARFHSLCALGLLPDISQIIENNNGSIRSTREQIDSAFQSASK